MIHLLRKQLLLASCAFLMLCIQGGMCSSAHAQSIDTLRVMQYNLLRFPGTTGATRAPLLRRIINYSKPHLITINEMSVPTGADFILTQVLNTGGETRWRRAAFIGGPDPYNMLFYRSDKFALTTQDSIRTVPRYTTGARLYKVDTGHATGTIDTTWFTVYQMHLLASQGSSNEAGRNVQCQALVSRMTQVVKDSNVLVTGDFNVYTSTEAAYQTLLAPGIHRLFDPINRPGAWNNNAAFASIHTQSPRTTSFGGGATGGMDDRFDFILSTGGCMNGRFGMRNLTSTYKALGNDGNHFNGALTTLPNGVVPDSIALALHDMSDHLPVLMDIEFTSRRLVGLDKQQGQKVQLKSPNPNPDFFELSTATTGSWTMLDARGAVVAKGHLDQTAYQTLPNPATMQRGIYMLYVQAANGTVSGMKLAYQ